MRKGDCSCCAIDRQASITGHQPWDVACKSKHHLCCAVLLGNVPPSSCLDTTVGDGVMARPLYLADTGGEDAGVFCFKSLKLVTFLE